MVKRNGAWRLNQASISSSALQPLGSSESIRSFNLSPMEAMTRKGGAKPIPSYLRPSTGSCHDACKHGGHHAFEEKQVPRAQPKPRKKQPSSASDDQKQKRRLVKVPSVSRRRVGDFSKPDKADTPAGGSENVVEWKDIVAYDAVPVQAQAQAPAPAPAPDDGPSHQQPDAKKKKKKRDVMKGKTPFAKTTRPETLVKKPTESLNKRLAKTVRSTLSGKSSMKKPQAAADKEEAGKSTQSPKAKKSATLPVENRDIVQGDASESDQEERAAIAESSRPIPAHRRAKSMSISSRSVRFPFTRQPSKNSATFKLRSKSSKAPILPSQQDKPTRLRFRKKGRAAGEEPSSSSSGGIQLRARSLRRRLSGGGGTGFDFVVPEVTLRHQKTLEKKKSRRLSNNLIQETASKLAKSRVKSLVGAFETLISKIAK